MLASFKTIGFNGFSVKFNPFLHNRFGCAASQNYGLTGRGNIYIFDFNEDIRCVSSIVWPHDALFDFAWSEVNPDILWSVSGDGVIEVYNINDQNPVQTVKAHNKEIYNIEWSQIRGETQMVLTSSWDEKVKLWDALTAQIMNTFGGHQGRVYSSSWSPLIPSTFTTTSSDGYLRLWSFKDSPEPSLTIKATSSELLTCDFCKYNQNLVATGATDGILCIWDLRAVKSNEPVFALPGHQRAIKKLKFSPFFESVVATASYDFTTRVWDFNATSSADNPHGPLLATYNNHSEFVYGLDFSNHINGQMVDCGWDQLVTLFSFPPLK